MTPAWLPDCRNQRDYPSDDAPLARWAWEFLRRNPEYQAAWAELIAPRLMSDGSLDLDARGNEPDPLRTMRARFGVAFIPPDPASAETLPVFEHNLVQEPDSGPSGQQLKREEVAIVFNVAWPIEAQIARAQEQLESWRARLLERGEIEVLEKRNHVEKWRAYLRLLDGTAAGLNLAELAKIVFPNIDDSYAGGHRGRKAVRNGLEAAEKLRDGDWRKITMYPSK